MRRRRLEEQRTADSLGYFRFGRDMPGDAASCKGPCFDNVREERDVVKEGGGLAYPCLTMQIVARCLIDVRFEGSKLFACFC